MWMEDGIKRITTTIVGTKKGEQQTAAAETTQRARDSERGSGRRCTGCRMGSREDGEREDEERERKREEQ